MNGNLHPGAGGDGRRSQHRPGEPPGASRPEAGDRWRLGLAGGALLLAATDTYVVVVALPSIMGGVGVGLDRLGRATPIITAFLLGYVAVLPLLGRIADLVGPEPVLAGCLVVFGLGSLLTASAHALVVVVAGRALQGLGGGGTVPVTLAMVAARWPAERRGLPLGVVGAVQELGSVLGPLYGAAIVTATSWRAIFWINLAAAGALGAGLAVARRGGRLLPAAGEVAGLSGTGRSVRADRPREVGGGRRDVVGGPREVVGGPRDVLGGTLASLGAVAVVAALAAPRAVTSSPTWGRAYAPVVSGPTWGRLTTPLALSGGAALVAFVAWEGLAAPRLRAAAPLRRRARALRRADPGGALLLAVVLGCVVVAFSTSDPSRQVVASSAPALAVIGVLAAIGFAWHQRRAATPLIGRGLIGRRPVWGALAVNLALGSALMAVLVDVPLFARATVDPGSEVAAALVLVRFLVAVPVGALMGGVLCRRGLPPGVVAAVGMTLAMVATAAMATWSAGALAGGVSIGGITLPLRASDVELVVGGLGFGLAVAPINAAVLAAVPADAHALTSSLAVVARTIGMLAGLSALTAIGLHRFYEAQAHIGSPFDLCPSHPGSCAAYTDATRRAVLQELHTIFGGAAVCALLAALLALAFLGARRVLMVPAPRAG